MKISTKGKYGLSAMLDLAVYSRGGHVSLKSIAERQDISENYLEQIFSTLRKAGFVKSIKGPQGGYIFAKDVCDITVGDILRSLEGSLSVIDENNISNRVDLCITKKVWQKIDESISAAVDSITMEDMVTEYKKTESESEYMFYI